MRSHRWSPYLSGGLIGLLLLVAMLSAREVLGITTAFEYLAAMVWKPVAPPDYYANLAAEGGKLQINWQAMFVVGAFFGAMLSVWLSGDREHDRPGYLATFLGGTLLVFGARLADACTSGHGISGNSQLALSSMIFTAIFFPVAAGVAHLLYARRPHVRES